MRGLALAALALGPLGQAGFDEGWTFKGRPVTLPHQFNVHDDSVRSFLGGTGVYRKRFDLGPGRWRIRFESVNNQAVVRFNGRRIGAHRGPFEPFELALTGARREGNRLTVRVDSRRRESDFPPRAQTADGEPRGGWFNAGGILRGVTLRRVRGDVDLEQVTVFADPGDVRVRARLRNDAATARRLPVTGTFGDTAFESDPVRVAAGGARTVVVPVPVRDPRRWSPEDPYLHDVVVRAGQAEWRGRAGVRSITVRRGRLFLNAEPLEVRGVGYHEDRPGKGQAISDADRRWIVDQAQRVGANALRTHYPPGEALADLADERGLLIWSEVPVFGVKTDVLARPAVRRRAVATVRRNVLDNGSHPSIFTWSLGNELNAEVGAAQRRYLRAGIRAVRRLDPARPISLAIFGYTSSLCQPALRRLDLIGVNEYYGWYDGPGGSMARRALLGPYLDRLRRCHPDEALVVSEFGAEANRRGPVGRKGTFAFQAEFVRDHLRTFSKRRWLSGAFYWALNEFRVRPGWDGGNPRPSPPLHKKGLVSYRGKRKPAWFVVKRAYTRSGSRSGAG